jgi:hypothetical protein
MRNAPSVHSATDQQVPCEEWTGAGQVTFDLQPILARPVLMTLSRNPISQASHSLPEQPQPSPRVLRAPPSTTQ